MSEDKKANIPTIRSEEGIGIPEGIVRTDRRKRIRKRVHYHIYTGDDSAYKEWVNRKFIVDRFHANTVGEEIIVRSRVGGPIRIVHRVWLWLKKDFACPMCNRTDNMVFNLQSTGVYIRCTVCNVTTGPESPLEEDSDAERADLMFEKEVSLSEARRILSRTGLRSPSGLPQRKTTRRKRKLS